MAGEPAPRTDSTGVLDEAYQRLHQTGPEFEGWLSNHGPMATEALVRMGHAGGVHRWLDRYLDRLEELPRPTAAIGAEEWREALGDAKRTGDWLVFFAAETRRVPWRRLLATWWPRLLPGIAAGATHGVIRTGHAVRALLEAETEPRIDELGQALAYWAARWQPVPSTNPPAGSLEPAAAIAGIPRITEQQGGIRDRLARLATTPGWGSAEAALRPAPQVDAVPGLLNAIADAAVTRYAGFAHGNPVMLVHSATAPSAVLLALPALPRDQWQASLGAAWAATAAVISAYAPSQAAPPEQLATTPAGPEDAADLAASNGDEHVIKFTEAALRAHARGAGPGSLTSAARAAQLIDPSGS
jgi:hypothetical protein